MTALHVAQVSGPCDDLLSVHSTFELAVEALLHSARDLHAERFGYVPFDLQTEALGKYRSARETLRKIEHVMTGSGWHARVVELEVDAAAARPQPV